MDAAYLAALAARVGHTDPALAVTPGRVLHVDGDYAAYYFAGNDDTPVIDAHRNFDAFLARKMRLAGASDYVIDLTAGWSDKGKRYKIATVKPYQGQRDGGRKPRNWDAMRTYLESYPQNALWADREADDAAAWAGARLGWEKVALLSRDKDYRMIPGVHVGWKDDSVVQLPPHESILANDLWYGPRWFWLQMLMGDTADNIPGLPKAPLGKDGKLIQCGEATAIKWLAGFDTEEAMASRVIAGYAAYYNEEWPDRFAEQAALLYLRPSDGAPVWDFLSTIPLETAQAYPEVEAAAGRLEARCV